MPGTANTEFSLGQLYWCVNRRLSEPLLGKVVALTDAIGKSIGLEFDKDVGGHSCDGHGENGHCLWVTPLTIYNEDEWKSVVGLLSAQKAFAHALTGNNYKTLTIDRATGKPASIDLVDDSQTVVQNTKNLIHAVSE